MQQLGIEQTTAGNAAFVTGLYMVLVPLAGRFFGHATPVATWAGIALAVPGLFLLTWTGTGMGPGDLLCLMGAVAVGYPFLTSHMFHLQLPLLGQVHLASAMFFDAGVFALVVGSTLMMLTAIAHQSVRSHRYHARLLEEQQLAMAAVVSYDDDAREAR